MQKGFDAQHLCGAIDRGADFGFATLGHAQTEGHVLEDVEMRVKCVGLKDHGDAALCRAEGQGILIVDRQRACVGRIQSGQDTQQGRLPTAGRADNDDEFAVAYIEIDTGQDGLRAERLFKPSECNRRHKPSLLSSMISEVCERSQAG